MLAIFAGRQVFLSLWFCKGHMATVRWWILRSSAELSFGDLCCWNSLDSAYVTVGCVRSVTLSFCIGMLWLIS